MGIFSKLKQTFSSKKDGDRYLSGLDKSKKSFSERIRKLALGFTGVNEEFLEDLMVVLLEADIGIKTAQKIVDEVESRAMDQKLKSFDEISECLIEVMHELYASVEDEDFHKNEDGPTVILMVGVNGSGKTTTLHAILKRIAQENRLHVVSLEDPIEIFDDSYLQLQINEAGGFTYEEGIKELLRHDPDVIMIGEIRDPSTARMLLRCALSGHLIFTTIHAKCCSEAIKRLLEFGLRREELYHTLSAVCAQRLYKKKGTQERVCIYEILEQNELDAYFREEQLPQQHRDIFQEIQLAVSKGIVAQEEAVIDLPYVQ